MPVGDDTSVSCDLAIGETLARLRIIVLDVDEAHAAVGLRRDEEPLLARPAPAAEQRLRLAAAIERHDQYTKAFLAGTARAARAVQQGFVGPDTVVLAGVGSHEEAIARVEQHLHGHTTGESEPQSRAQWDPRWWPPR